MTHQAGNEGQQRQRTSAQQRLGTAVVLVGTAAGVLTGLTGTALAASSPAVVASGTSGLPAAAPTRQQDIAAFLKAGYTYSDAQQLAALWHSPSVVAAKVRAGAKLLAGGTLPIPPHSR